MLLLHVLYCEDIEHTMLKDALLYNLSSTLFFDESVLQVILHFSSPHQTFHVWDLYRELESEGGRLLQEE